MRKLTFTELRAITQMRCGKCRKHPPFEDGPRCHKHRLNPKLGYVKGNVVPRCPECHGEEPGGRHNFARTAYRAGLKGARATAKLIRTDAVAAFLHKIAARKGGRIGARKQPRWVRVANGRKGDRSKGWITRRKNERRQ